MSDDFRLKRIFYNAMKSVKNNAHIVTLSLSLIDVYFASRFFITTSKFHLKVSGLVCGSDSIIITVCALHIVLILLVFVSLIWCAFCSCWCFAAVNHDVSAFAIMLNGRFEK